MFCHFCREADCARLAFRNDDGVLSVFREYSATCRWPRGSSIVEIRKNMPHRPSDPGIVSLRRAARRYRPVNIYPFKLVTPKVTSPDGCGASSNSPAALFPSSSRTSGIARAALPDNADRHDLRADPSCDSPCVPGRTLAPALPAVSASQPPQNRWSQVPPSRRKC